MSIMFYAADVYWPEGDPGSGASDVEYSKQYFDVSGDAFFIKYSRDQADNLRACGGFIPFVPSTNFPNPSAWMWFIRPQ